VHFPDCLCRTGLAVALVVLHGCGREQQPDVVSPQSVPSAVTETHLQFDEVQVASGIQFRHFGSRRDSLLPEDVGSGVGWADYDNDGDDDLYLVNFAGPFLMEESELEQRPGNQLYRNDGNGKFTDVTANAGVGHVGWDFGCLWFDYDNDGWLDLAVTHYHGVVLYRNRQDNTFEDATATAGVQGIDRFLQGMTAADYDLDGDLDWYLCGYVDFDQEKARNRPVVSGRPSVWTNPVSYLALPNILLQNNGNGTFIDVTEAAGVTNAKGKSMQALFCDFDNDGWPDLYVGNDVGTADVLFHNKRNGTFENVAATAGTYDRRASMGLAVGDVWHRGCMDLLTTHWVAEDHALWKNIATDFESDEPAAAATLLFDDVGPATGIVKAKASAMVGWGTGLYDFDNDGHLDVMIANGSTIEDELTLEVLSEPKLIPQESQLLWNNGKAEFINVGDGAGEFFQKHLVNRGMAFSDYNQDGRIDVAIIGHNAPAILLQNRTENSGHWLHVRLRGTQSNVFGVGARVEVRAGGVVHSRQCVLSSSYLSCDSLLCHFGLGDAETIEELKVIWPNGTVTVRKDVSADQIVEIEE
jgi:enediyne biosynthesis protein E4